MLIPRFSGKPNQNFSYINGIIKLWYTVVSVSGDVGA